MGDVSLMNFDHIQIFVKKLETLDFYKELQIKNNTFRDSLFNKKIDLSEPKDGQYLPYKQDIVKQMIWGFGYRITAYYEGQTSRSLVLSTAPTNQVSSQYVVTVPIGEGKVENFDHFSGADVSKFFNLHNGREGFSVFGFHLKNKGSIDEIYKRCKEKHPLLLKYQDGPKTYQVDGGNFRILEIYTFYKEGEEKVADEGTVMRFMEKPDSPNGDICLPGLTNLEAVFPIDHIHTYFDHWVSNVMDRKQYLDTLKDILEFAPKVDFNAGVVAAGEAIIESTVAGNTSQASHTTKNEFLKDHSQIFLPINNPLSEVGHVAGFIKELGQGIQHIANRVESLVDFVEKANLIRKASGEGFSFLRIPRSYYGRLEIQQLVQTGISEEIANEIVSNLVSANLSTKGGIVNINISDNDLENFFSSLSESTKNAIKDKEVLLTKVIKTSRFLNLRKLLHDVLSDETYLKIVENQILVDIQGKDVLYQIFTSNVLQEGASDEAPFLEYIQRVCGIEEVKHLKPGCGGFGIRNFLTLFLSIEVSKALTELDAATEAKNEKAQDIARQKVNCLSTQLEVSNPILTSISDSMTAEAEAMEKYNASQNEEEKEKLKKEIESYRNLKEKGQKELMVVSDTYKNQMAAIRLASQQ